jgi:uncharacterized protein YfaS (alpha-2-macroglobulin family)
VGSAISKVISTQDLIVRLVLPRFFTQHDQAHMTAIVHNYTKQPQKVTLSLNPSSQFETREALAQRLTVKPDGAERYGWPVDVVHSGEGIIAVKAIGETEGDALEMKVPIRPLAIEISEAQAGILKNNEDDVALPFKIPANTSPALANVLLSVAASSIGPVLGSFDSLIDYPYGCTEQTMSRLVPAMVAITLNRKLNLPIIPAREQKFEAVATQSLARLKDYHNPDGGWGWWQYDDSDAYLSAYVMEGLHNMQLLGYQLDHGSLPDAWRQDGINWLKKATQQLSAQLSDPKIASDPSVQADRLIDWAYMHYVLSLYGEKTTEKDQKALLNKIKTAPPEALAYLTLAFSQQNNPQAAQQFYQALNRLAETTAQTHHWDHTPALAQKLGLKNPDYTYRFTGIESTALGLRATVAMENGQQTPQNADAIENWLILQRGKDGWANTKTTALVLRAMMEKAIELNKPGETQFTVDSNVWQTAKAFSEANLYAAEQTTTLSVAALKNEVIHLKKQGAGQLYYSALLNYWMPLKPGDTIPQKAMPQGLKVKRQFFRIHTEAVGPTGTLRLKTQPIEDNRVKAGETVLMKVLVDSPVALPYVIVDNALPSGGEVISNDPRENLIQDEQNDFNGDWGNWWWTHQDILDDRVIMFASALPAGQSQFYALVRMELPGTFHMNPVKLESMYSQRVKAYSTLDTLQVTE